MHRTGALAVVALGLLGLGVGARMRGPSAAPVLDCAPARVRLVDGVARCGGAGAVPSAAQRLMRAVEAVTARGEVLTPDLGGSATTAQVTEAVIAAVAGANR